MITESELRQSLLCRRHEILQRIARVNGDVDARSEPYDPDATDRAIEFENLEVLFEIDAASRLELGQINRTLERLDEGRYGRCNSCGRPIEPQRQKVLPYAETCIACAH